MTNNKKSFLLHIDSLDILDDLTDEQAGLLFKAIKAHQKSEGFIIDSIVKIAFSPFKNQFIRDDDKYENICAKRAESGSKGGSVYSKDPGIDNFGEMQLYVIRLYNENEDFIKIGTTTNKLNRRFSGPKNMPYNYEVLYQIIDSKSFALEDELQVFLSEYSYVPSIIFPGYTECFTKISIKKLVEHQAFAQAKQSKYKQSKANLADNKNKNKTNSGNDLKDIHQLIVDEYENIFSGELSRIKKLTAKRKSAINGCIKEMKGTEHDFNNIETWIRYFNYASGSDFLMGRSGDWTMDFDFLITKSKMLKIVEGAYDNK